MLGRTRPRHGRADWQCEPHPPSAIHLILATGLWFVAWLVSGSPTAAHDGAPFILLQPAEAAAGDRISAYVDLTDPTTSYRIVLAGLDVEIDVGAVTTDAVGHGSLKVDIARDLVPGIYAVRAIGTNGLVASTKIAVHERPPADAGLVLGAVLAVLAFVLLVAGAIGRRSHGRDTRSRGADVPGGH